MVFLAKAEIVSKYDLSSLKIVFSGAAPLSKETEDAVKNRIGIPIVRQGYGMTEGTVGFTAQDDNNYKPGGVGVLNAGVSAKIIDVESGRSLGANEQGELLFKGITIMKGYIGDTVATQNTIDSDGWLHTGDIGYYDADGEFFIVDRLKELIKYNGYQVPPAEIESLLLQHPKISDAGVIGVPNERAGELALAFVVTQPGQKITADEIIQFVASQASQAKRLHGGVIFVDAIPKNPSGKILRKELRELIKNQKAKL